MGSYATLRFGDREIADWKSHIPIEPILMFSENDLSVSFAVHPDGGEVEDEASDEAEDDECRVYAFRTRAADARVRLDVRGITMAFCQRLFEEFWVPQTWLFDSATGTSASDPNPLDFEGYCEAVKRSMAVSRYEFAVQPPTDPLLAALHRGSFLSDDLSDYFSDAAFVMELRVSLEVVDPDTEIVFDLTDLVCGGWLRADDLPHLHDRLLGLMLRRIGVDYQIYGFVTSDDPNLIRRLKERIEPLDEDSLINAVLLPLLDRMGFQRLRTSFHGPGEFGNDILPFRRRTPFGMFEYLGLQAKAVPIHGTSSVVGNAAELVSQATQALATAFIDNVDNERKRIDKFAIVTNKAITASARQFIEAAVEGRRSLIFVDCDALLELIREHKLVEYVLFADLKAVAGAV